MKTKSSAAMSKGDISQNLQKAGDDFVEGARRFRDSLAYLTESISLFLDNHRLLKAAILLPVSAALGGAALHGIARVHLFLFGAIVPVSRDIEVTVFPAPIGTTLWILTVSIILLTLYLIIRLVTLRQRIEDLEDKVTE